MRQRIKRHTVKLVSFSADLSGVPCCEIANVMIQSEMIIFLDIELLINKTGYIEGVVSCP